jgi:hypothetical protein
MNLKKSLKGQKLHMMKDIKAEEEKEREKQF